MSDRTQAPDHPGLRRPLGFVWSTTLPFAVAASHCLVRFLLVRNRVIGGSHAGDLVVFGVPAVAACVGYAAVIRRRAGVRRAGAIGAAVGLTFLPLWAAMFVSLNAYGS